MFDSLTPEDFARTTSAVDTTPLASTDFNTFVTGQLTRCRRIAETDEFPPTAVLCNTDECRYFLGEDDEIPADFARRLSREAQDMNATWAFVAITSPARAIPAGADMPEWINPDDIEAVTKALRNGDLQFGICWTANNRDCYRGGIIYLDNAGRPGEEVEGEMDPDLADPFRGIL